jgi:hypothetical protein
MSLLAWSVYLAIKLPEISNEICINDFRERNSDKGLYFSGRYIGGQEIVLIGQLHPHFSDR